MSDNFRPSYFDELFGSNTVKAPFPGGKTKNFNILLELALRSNPNLKTIYMGLDLQMLDDEDADEPRQPFPYYLYDDNPFNDISYLLNKDVLIKHTGTSVVNTLTGIPPMTFDEYSYRHSEDFKFGRFVRRRHFRDYTGNDSRIINSLPREELLKLAKEHITLNIIPLVSSYPQTEFVFFFPPYSIVYWYDKDTEDIVAVLQYVIEALIHYDNVSLFLPMGDPDIVTNINNYRDAGHYCASINDYLSRCFKDGTYLLTLENYQSELDKLTEMVNEFDYLSLFD